MTDRSWCSCLLQHPASKWSILSTHWPQGTYRSLSRGIHCSLTLVRLGFKTQSLRTKTKCKTKTLSYKTETKTKNKGSWSWKTPRQRLGSVHNAHWRWCSTAVWHLILLC